MIMTALQESIHAAKEKVDALRKADSLVLPLFTDLHANGAEHVYTKMLTETLHAVTTAIQCDVAVDLGDNFSMLGRNHHISNKDLMTVTEALIGTLSESAGCPMLYVNGNHDAIGTDFFMPSFWNKAVKGRFENAATGYDESGSYCYFDHAPSRTRLVILSCPSSSDIGAEHPTPHWELGKQQLAWLQNEALQTEHSILLLMHVPPFYWYHGDMEQTLPVWTGERAASAYIANLCGWIADRNELTAILQDYRKRPGARLIACFSGHTHEDSLWMPFEERGEDRNTLPCPQVVTRGACIPPEAHKEYGVSLDIAVWTPSKNELHIIRVGDGEDRKVPIL